MVSLTVYHQSPSPAQAAADDENRLRNSGMWYPDVPGPNLCLNEDSFSPRDHYLGGYQPLFWTSFGGQGGVYLQHLTGLSVVWGGGGVRRVDFAYDVAVPSEHRTFGCQMPGEWTRTIDFALDGPGGEIIEAVEVFQHYPEAGYRWMVKEGTMEAFRVSQTNMRPPSLRIPQPQPPPPSRTLPRDSYWADQQYEGVHKPREVMPLLVASRPAKQFPSSSCRRSWYEHYRVLWKPGAFISTLDEV